ncbi:hypothetical protein [Bradyrhizobium septentrionale]|nr:hypothetical protein [Bradyrhizobium septentrionale]
MKHRHVDVPGFEHVGQPLDHAPGFIDFIEDASRAAHVLAVAGI